MVSVQKLNFSKSALIIVGVVLVIILSQIMLYAVLSPKSKSKSPFEVTKEQIINAASPKPTNTVTFQELKSRQSLNPRHVCNCTFKRSMLKERRKPFFVESTCSDEATLLGLSQKVISYSLYQGNPTVPLNKDLRYFGGAKFNIAGVRQYYPGWVIRIYSNIPLRQNNEMCHLICSDEIVFYCDINQLPLIGNLSQITNVPMLWRVAVLGDATVDKFLSRDIDCRITQRERDAVGAWEESRFKIHGMRDHPFHRAKILGGMWGADNSKLGFGTGWILRHDIMNFMPSPTLLDTVTDQDVLGSLLFTSKFREDILIHDSYHCILNRSTRPFPSKRHNASTYVGQIYTTNENPSISDLPPCPLRCRPAEHRDWTYC